MKLNAKELRLSEPTEAQLKKIVRKPIYIVCDNVLDTYNIGSIFRLADAVAASKVYLCGQSETPPNSRIAKASVGTDKWVPWQYDRTAKDVVLKLKTQNPKIKIIAIEQSKSSVDFRKVNYQLPETSYQRPGDQALAFIVGHETDGVSKEALALCDQIVEIPMFGINKSLNVMVSLAIVMFRSI